MNPKLLLCLALILSGGLFGCSTTKTDSTTSSDAEEKIQLPIKFAGYRELYAFIARETFGDDGVSPNADTIFKLAADNETETYELDYPPSYLWVITPHYFNGGIIDGIRGEQGNGSYYVLRPLAGCLTSGKTDCGFELVGIAWGNTLSFSGYNQTTRLITSWHISAGEHPETVYEWTGKCFEQVNEPSQP